jgi:hypothetical protein
MRRSWSDWRLSVRWVPTRARTMAGLMGLLMKSTAPACRPWVSASSPRVAVTKITGISAVSASAFS